MPGSPKRVFDEKSAGSAGGRGGAARTSRARYVQRSGPRRSRRPGRAPVSSPSRGDHLAGHDRRDVAVGGAGSARVAPVGRSETTSGARSCRRSRSMTLRSAFLPGAITPRSCEPVQLGRRAGHLRARPARAAAARRGSGRAPSATAWRSVGRRVADQRDMGAAVGETEDGRGCASISRMWSMLRSA